MVIKTGEEFAACRARLEYGKKVEKALQQKLHEERTATSAIEQEIAEYLAEFKPGTRVLYNGVPFMVTSVRLSYGNSVVYYAKKIKKDGTPGGVVRQMYAWRSDTIVLDPQQSKDPS